MSALPEMTDDWLDARLRDVAVPSGLVERLQQTAGWADVEIDAELSNVHVRPALIAQLQRLSTLPAPRLNWQRMALAASLFIAVWSTYASLVGARLAMTVRPSHVASNPWLNTKAPDQGMQITAAVTVDPQAIVQPGDLVDLPSYVFDQTPQIELAAVEREQPLPMFPSPFPDVERGTHDARKLARLQIERFGADVLGASARDEELPEWRLMPGLVPRGVEPPRSPGFDLAFLHATRFHPVVAPLDKELATSVVPLNLRHESLLLARQFLEQGELPPAEMIRTEEFLAGLDYGFPLPTRDRLALQVAAGPSPLGGPQLKLLQVGVQAAATDIANHPPAHLIVCIDTSAGMQRGARLEMTRAALLKLLTRLAPQDRLSLISAGPEVRVLIEQASYQDTEPVTRILGTLTAEGTADPVGALRLAYGLAAESAVDRGLSQQVLLISNGYVAVDPSATASMEAYLRAGGNKLARLWLVDIGQTQVTPAHWTQLAEAAEGRLSQAASMDEIRWVLLQTLSGKSQRVAADVSLSVWFNPQAVAGYRLFGNEATLLTSPTHSDVSSGQTGIGLYELQLKPKAPDHIATATVTWRDPLTGQRRTLSQKIVRANFANTFSSEPASLQLATLAAEAAELLRRSPYREASSYRLWRELASEASGPLVENKSFQELASIVRQAERARPAPARLRQLWQRGSAR